MTYGCTGNDSFTVTNDENTALFTIPFSKDIKNNIIYLKMRVLLKNHVLKNTEPSFTLILLS